MNPFPYSDSNKRYHTYTWHLKQAYGQKVSRISLNAGLTCPNIDGTRGTGGCIYCSAQGSGEFGGDPQKPVAQQFEEVAARMGTKWDTEKHIAYFQSFTNTYAPAEKLRRLYQQALDCPGVVGLTIATRADCLDDEICDLLCKFNETTDLVVELGLQSVWDETGKRINRCHTFEEFLAGYQKLQDRSISTGIHLINGLPGETPEMMLDSARIVGKLSPYLIKIHLLHVLRGTRLAQLYEAGEFPLLTREEYVQIVCDQLERIPAQVVIARLTGDGAPEELIGPMWSLKKLCVLNEIDKELARRDSWQGKLLDR